MRVRAIDASAEVLDALALAAGSYASAGSLEAARLEDLRTLRRVVLCDDEIAIIA